MYTSPYDKDEGGSYEIVRTLRGASCLPRNMLFTICFRVASTRAWRNGNERRRMFTSDELYGIVACRLSTRSNRDDDGAGTLSLSV